MEELDDARTQLNKLRTENSELLHDARSARTYRDEVDILKEKVSFLYGLRAGGVFATKCKDNLQ